MVPKNASVQRKESANIILASYLQRKALGLPANDRTVKMSNQRTLSTDFSLRKASAIAPSRMIQPGGGEEPTQTNFLSYKRNKSVSFVPPRGSAYSRGNIDVIVENESEDSMSLNRA